MKKNEISVAIIGGGVMGIGLLATLNKNNINCDLYEKYEDVGGTWHLNTFVNLKAQVPSGLYRYHNFTYERNINMPSGKQIKNYIKDYIDHNKIKTKINCNKNVYQIFNIVNKYVLVFTDNKQSKKYDYVIFTGTTFNPFIPKIFLNPKLGPVIIHSSELNKKTIDLIKNKKIIVYGGSKSSCDVVSALSGLNCNSNLLWVARTFSSYTLNKKFYLMILNLFFKRFNLEKIFNINIAPDLGGINIGSGNVITDDELTNILKVKKIRGIIENINNDYCLINNKKYEYDYIILCLGYEYKYPLIINYDKNTPRKAFYVPLIPFNNYNSFLKLLDSHIIGNILTKYFIEEPDMTPNDYIENFKNENKYYLIIYYIFYILYHKNIPSFELFKIYFNLFFLIIILYFGTKILK